MKRNVGSARDFNGASSSWGLWTACHFWSLEQGERISRGKMLSTHLKPDMGITVQEMHYILTALCAEHNEHQWLNYLIELCAPMCMCNTPIRQAGNDCLLYKQAIVNSCLIVSLEDQMAFLLSCPIYLVIFLWADFRKVFCVLRGSL